jgi:hypothetical protein
MKNKLKQNYHRKSIRQYYHDNVNCLHPPVKTRLGANQSEKVEGTLSSIEPLETITGVDTKYNSLQTKTEEPLLTEKPSSGGFEQSETMDNHKARGAVDTRYKLVQLEQDVGIYPESHNPQTKQIKTSSVEEGIPETIGLWDETRRLDKTVDTRVNYITESRSEVLDSSAGQQLGYIKSRPESHLSHWYKTALGRKYLEART